MNLIIKSCPVAIVVVCSFASPLQAAEGFLMVEKTVTGTATRTTQVQLERDRLRAEMSGPTGETQIVVFDGPQQVLRIINVDRKLYTEMTKADADRMGAQANTVRAAMKEKIAQLPPEQREKIGGDDGASERRDAWCGRRNPSSAAPATTKSASGRATSTKVSGTR